MKSTFIVFIIDKIWQRYTRRPHYSGLAKFGELLVIEYPLTIFSKEFLKKPFKEIKYYFKYSRGKRIDKLSGAKIIRPIIIFPTFFNIKFFEYINRKFVDLFIFSSKIKQSREIFFLTYYNQEWLISKRTKNRKYILEMNDEWSLIGYNALNANKIKNLTCNMIKQVNLVITVTKKLRDEYNFNNNALYLPNGVDIEHYAPKFDTETVRKKEMPLNININFLRSSKTDPNKYSKSIEILKEIGKPIIGSISGLSGNWSDFEFMKNVEVLLPKHFSLISTGNIFPPTKEEFLDGYKKYINKPRMVFLGHLDYSILPDFLEKIDVGLVMHRMDYFNTHSAPNKIWAYLAMGLPVVSTDFLTEPDKEIFEGMVAFAKTPEEYVMNIIYAKENDNKELKNKRRELAIKNSTFNRAKKIVDIVQEKLSL